MPVVTIGYPAVRVLADQGQITSLAVDSPVEAMVDAVAALDGPVLVLHPAWAAEPALRHLRTAVSALEAGPLVVAASWLPPLAGGVLAALASAVSPRLAGLGVLAAALPALEAELVVVSRLGSVASLAQARSSPAAAWAASSRSSITSLDETCCPW